MQRVEDKLLSVISGNTDTLFAKILRFFLLCLSKIYSLVVRLRLRLFEGRVFRSTILGCPVISVGNITIGGTGKTPVVEMLARALSNGGRKVAIISRGYMKKKKPFWKKSPFDAGPDVVSDGNKIYLDAIDAGDEPYMLARNLKDVCVLVDKNRIRAGTYAINHFGADTILFDDGFQYLKIQKSHEILLIDSTNPFGYEHLLPRGLLREPKEHLSRANFIFLTKTEKVETTQPIRDEIHRLANGKSIFECIHDPKYLVEIATGQHCPLETLKGKKICALSAIAIPDGFEDTLKRLGADIVLRSRYRDHHPYTRKEMRDVIDEARNAKIEWIITTEKDAVRIPKIYFDDVRLFYLRVEIKLVKGAVDFIDFVNNSCYN